MSAHGQTDASADRGMVKVMGMVLFSLLLLSLFLFSTARLVGLGRDDGDSDPLMRNALISRIEPVGRVRTSADELPHGDGIEVAAAGGASGRSGEELVNGICAGCHLAGAAGAPLLDDEAAWAERRELGLDALVASVIDGKGAMPARGGSDYSDEEIRLAVQHIALFDTTEDAAPAEAESAGEAPATEDAAAEEGADDAEATEEEAAAVEASEDTASAEAPAEEIVAAAADAAGDGSVDLVALLASGEAPAGLPDNVKASVDGLCAGCHIAGVANAPKIGDKEAWGERAELGLAALSQSVINGKGAMPARGGSQLSDEEIALAIQYLMVK